jgi:Amidohydrolase family
MKKVLLIILALAFVQCNTGTTVKSPTLAIKHVTIVDVTGGTSRADMTVLIRGDEIAAITQAQDARLPQDAQVLDAKNGWLIPGLWDMHVHAHREGRTESFYPLFVAHGITGIREMGSHLASLLAWRKAWKSENLVPRVVWGTPMLDAAPPTWSHGLGVETPEAARAAVRSLKDAGFDFVKIYERLPRDVYFAIAEECKAAGIPFAGHVPITLTPVECARAGQRSIEHMRFVLESCIPGALERRVALGYDQIGGGADPWLAESLTKYDSKTAQSLFKEFIDNGTWQVPTLTVIRGAVFVDDISFSDDSRLVYVLPHIRKRWEEYKASIKPAECTIGRRLYAKWVELAGEMHKAGVGMLAGTDASDEPWVFAGSSLHDELELLVQAGLTPLEALQTATLNPAKYLGATTTMGTIAPGMKADLIVLDADPLADIRNTQRIRSVVLRGRLLDRQALDGLLAEARTIAKQQMQ